MERFFRILLIAIGVGSIWAGGDHAIRRGDWLTFAVFAVWGLILFLLAYLVANRPIEVTPPPSAPQKTHRFRIADRIDRRPRRPGECLVTKADVDAGRLVDTLDRMGFDLNRGFESYPDPYSDGTLYYQEKNHGVQPK